MAQVRDPYEFTATGILGDRRETMLENEILLRSELAKPVTRGYSRRFPGSKSTYGVRNIPLDGGVAEALGKWDFGKLSKGPRDNMATKEARDYLKLNKAAVSKGLVSHDEHRQFQATNNWRQPVLDTAGMRMPVKKLSPHIVYGRPVRPSTPINDIIEHRFQDRWIEKQRKRIVAGIHSNNAFSAREPSEYVSSLLQMRTQKALTQDTRTSMLRAFQVPVKDPPLWKMPRFTKTARPQLETFRSCVRRENAFTNASFDGATRRGIECSGVYNQAKH